ncbi:MAG: LysM peptidoglycan-binding domain-containing protein [Caldilineaceae bacterium]|nr:LysM peptidoglycan-binding domain-containing protein [Caldilineaceae bacterium]
MDKFTGRFSPYRLISVFLLVGILALVLPNAVLAAPSSTADNAPHAHYTWYVVQPGDSLSKIAWRYGTTVSALMLANGLANANHIYVGQRLKIATGYSSCPRYHTVVYGETLSGIAAWYGISTYSLAQANSITNYNHVYSGQSLCIPGWGEPAPAPAPSAGFWYVVTYGDTLSGIAWRYGTSAYAIMAANNLTSINRILVGQKLWIPSGYAPPPGPAPKPTPVPPPPAPAAITGGPWTALYFNNKDLSGTPADTRVDGKIHFDWGMGSPSGAVNSDGFSVLWTSINTFEAATYQFTSTADDGVRLYVDGTLVIDDWNVHPATDKSGEIALSAGSHTVQVRYFEDTGMASIFVRWAKK